MSFEQLREWNKRQAVEPPPLTDVTSHEELAKQGRGVEGIVAQRRIETWFATISPADPSSLPADPYSDEGSFDLADTFRSDRFHTLLQKTNFALGFPQRLIRSAMALTGISARAERFGDIRKSMSFFMALADLMNSLASLSRGMPDERRTLIRSLEMAEEIPSILTDPTVPEDTLPGVGRVVIEMTGAPEQMEWIYDLVGELWIEANVIKATKTIVRKAASKLMKTTYEAGDQVQKRGIKHILGQMTDDELAAIDEATRFRKVGKLGTKPPQQEIDDAFKRTFEYIKESGDARLTKKETITAARRQAAARMHAVQRSADKTGEYGPGLAARMRAAGRAEKAEKAFTPLLEVPEEVGQRLPSLKNQGKLGFFEEELFLETTDEIADIVAEVAVNEGDRAAALTEGLLRKGIQTESAHVTIDEIIIGVSNLSKENKLLFQKAGFTVKKLPPLSGEFIHIPNKPFVSALSSARQADLTTLNKVIANHDFAGRIYTQANAHEALAKLYEYGELLTRGEVELLRDVLGHDFANALTKFTVKPVGVAGKMASVGGKTLKGLAATSRTLMTTSELSFLLRQANFRAWTRPKDAMRSFAVAARSLLSPTYARHMDDAFRFSKAGKAGIEHGLFLGRFDEGARLLGREEVFMAEWLHRVPGLGKVVKAFERGYVSGLNSIRLDWFDEGYRILQRTGKAGNDDLVRQWATYVNNMTGRADIDNIADANKAMKAMAEIAQQTLFAPRFAASKWNRHRVAAQLMFGKETPNAMRRMLAGDTVLRWRRYERLAHYAKQNGFEVEEDPRSADFLKIKVGDTRFDILGGDMQLQVLAARLVTGETKDTSTGLFKDILANEIAIRYAAGKLNPLWSLAIDKFVGATFEGEDIDDPKVLAKTILNKFIPLYLQDIKDKIFLEYETEGGTYADAIESGVSTIGLGFLGAGVQTYEPSARKEYELMVNDKAQELYAKDFADLVPYRKEEVLWEAENDDIDRTDRLKEEMGMTPITRKTAAKMQKAQNKADRRVRDGLGTDYRWFSDSNIATNGLSATVQDVKLNAEQHDFLNDIYVKFIKRELRQFPRLKELKPEDFSRRQWLQDILSDAREDAQAELFFIEPEE